MSSKVSLLPTLFSFCILVCPMFCSPISDCGSNKAKLLDVRVSNCEGKDACPLLRGNLTYLEIDFQTLKPVEKITASVYGKIGEVTLPFMGVNKKGCDNSGLSCPLEVGRNYTYNNTIDVKSYFPPVNVEVLWKLMDKKEVVVCASIKSVLV